MNKLHILYICPSINLNSLLLYIQEPRSGNVPDIASVIASGLQLLMEKLKLNKNRLNFVITYLKLNKNRINVVISYLGILLRMVEI